MKIEERVARVLEPQAWLALGLCDTLAYKNRRTSSLRKAQAALAASGHAALVEALRGLMMSGSREDRERYEAQARAALAAAVEG